jgi:hypothetical protein
LFTRNSALGVAAGSVADPWPAAGWYQDTVGFAPSSPGIIGLLIIGTIMRPLGASSESPGDSSIPAIPGISAIPAAPA